MSPIWRRFLPEQTPPSWRERLRSALGALIGIVTTGLVCAAALGPDPALPALIAPMGASAVLLFAVPASPLAQPWSIIGGNLVAALVGVTAGMLVQDPVFAAGIAIAGAIALMMSLRCIHPPSGAVALTAVLGGPAVHGLGYGFVLWPVGANSLLLLTTALVFNTLAGRTYPNARIVAPDHHTSNPAPSARIGFTSSDLDAALKDFDRVLDVGRGDLEAILRQAQINAYGRRSGQVTCAEIMSRDVVGVAPGDTLAEALKLLRRHRIKVLPVTDESARVLGIVTQTDLLDKATWDRRGPRLGLGRRLGLMLQQGRAPHGRVEDIMTRAVKTLVPDSTLAEVAMRMSEAELHHLPVVGSDRRLVGIVSQTDVVAALLAEAVGQRQAPSVDAMQGADAGLPA